jgi:HEPN domain-containing protein
MRRLTEEWIAKAESDLQAAEILSAGANHSSVLDAVCFHAQQCVEKYLKAWLIDQQQASPRTHDLEALAKLCLPRIGELVTIMPRFRFLTSFAVEIRYPGTSAMQQDAERCLSAARETRRILRSRVGA